MHSCLYVGQLRHRRHAPVVHAFQYRLFMLYLDLDELQTVFRGRWLWSARRPALAWFRRADHLGDPQQPLAESVRDLVQAHTGARPRGPIRLLTHLRYFGYGFNPVSFFYCFDAGGARVETIVAEVNNTPWGERHCYVLGADTGARTGAGTHRYRLAKRFHVSPFMPLSMNYDWRFATPGRHLAVHMINERDGQRVFDATLALRRRPVGAATLAGVLAAHPLMTVRVIVAIYWQALRLWIKRCPIYSHPAKDIATRTP